jgi:DNA-binding CsgD family transcriptional regulator
MAAGSSTPVAMVQQTASFLCHQLGCAAVAVAIADDFGARTPLAAYGYTSSALTYLLTDFVKRDPIYDKLSVAGERPQTWDDLPSSKESFTVRSVLRPLGFTQGTTVRLEGDQRRAVGEVHINFSSTDQLSERKRQELTTIVSRLPALVIAAGRASHLHLTGRQTEILTLIAEGWANKRIAAELNISVRTVDVHVRNICATLQVDTRVEAVVRAMRVGLIELHSNDPLRLSPGRLLRTGR